MLIQGYRFLYIENIILERNHQGKILKYRPPLESNKALHRFGKGPFCKFKINVNDELCGVYALVVDKNVRYIGECQNLKKRFNQGYGHISPCNCYIKKGQQTNCHINTEIMKITNNGGRVSLYFLKTKGDRKEIERKLIVKKNLYWNR